MTNEPVGIAFRETMSGHFALGETDPQAGDAAGKRAATILAMHAEVEIRDLDRFVSDSTHTGGLTGHIDFPPFGRQLAADHGVFRLFSPSGQQTLRLMVYELAFAHQGQPYYLAGRKEVRNDRGGADLWNDTTTLLTRLHRGADTTGPVIGAGILHLGVAELAKLVSTVRVTNADGPADQARTIARFGQFFMGNLWETYGPTRAS
jgi:hypothetical protein